jgi:hypothetical protein
MGKKSKAARVRREPDVIPVVEKETPVWTPLVPALCALLGLLPTISPFAQSGDGYELVVTALKGGVLHPPGFPLQAWIDKLFISLPFRNPEFRISLVSYFSHVATVYFIADGLRRLKCGLPAQLLGGLAFGLFISMWVIGVAPEVFALTHLTISLLTWFMVRLVLKEKGQTVSIGDAIGVGVLFGLALSQHLISSTSAVGFLSALAFLYRRNRKFTAPAVSVFTTLLVASMFYASLPLFATADLTPDWGDLSSPAKVLDHAVRAEYGIGRLSAVAGARTFHGSVVLIKMLMEQWHLALILLAAGIIEITRSIRFNSYVKAILLGQLALGGLLLLRAQMQDEQLISEYILMRFQGPFLIAAAVFLGLGFQVLVSGAEEPPSRKVQLGMAAGFIILLFGMNFGSAKPPSQDVLGRFMDAVKLSLPKEAVYVTTSDVESFWGLSSERGIRFPIEAGMFTAGWYNKDILPRVEPRIDWSGQGRPTMETVVKGAGDQGLKVASTNPYLLKDFGALEIQGVVYVLTPEAEKAKIENSSIKINATSIAAAKAKELCSIIGTMDEISKYHASAKYLLSSMAVAFEGASAYLRLVGRGTEAGWYGSTGMALKFGGPASTWKENCVRIGKAE